eukprot:GILK01007388.1.p1 GENE.GILK01007388.1~~GILK01007388.1.p1  ORF type:complete len:315 (-),score=45.49 GILK01007388.1:242-1186(-)
MATLLSAARKGDRAALERRLNAGDAVNATDSEGNTALHLAVEATKNELPLLECLLAHNADVDVQNAVGATPLHYCALRKTLHREVAELLLRRGANPNVSMGDGKTPLFIASDAQCLDLVECLLANGANATIVDREHNCCLHSVFVSEGRESAKRPLVEALIAAGCPVQLQNRDGVSPLHLAAQTGYVRLVQLLLERGAVVNTTTNAGDTCMHFATKANSVELMDLLYAFDSDLLNRSNNQGNTPLHVAATEGKLEAAVFLIKRGADLNVKNSKRETPYDIVRHHGRMADLHSAEMANLLKVARDKSGDGKCILQ